MKKKSDNTWQDIVGEWLYSIIIAVVLAFCIRTFVVEPYMVSGPSMLPTLENGERLLVNKFVYLVSEPKRDEIVIFKYPMDESRDFIKRVIAVGGDTIEIRDGQVYVNGALKK
ncbi:MAG: signal peptidase I, partial [Acidaminococcaceae bacterium]